jgi:tRNA threonylcarbamoyladenosine modification (KEOPS) complex  Pcc1 subunit
MMEKRKSGKGNPNPSPATRFQAGERANPNGKTSEQKRAEMKAGEIAAQIQLRMLQALNNAVSADDAAALQAIAADPLRLIKDAMDREYGTAVQKVDNTSSDGSMTTKTIIATMTPQEAAEAYAATLAPNKG